MQWEWSPLLFLARVFLMQWEWGEYFSDLQLIRLCNDDGHRPHNGSISQKKNLM
jgi:hypothetical protein